MLPRLFLSLLFTCVLAWQALGLTPGQRVVLFGHPFVGVIDQLGVAPAADYSSRCLTRNWLGKHVVNIRRTSDSANTDLNCLAPSGNLDSSTFNTFCAATTCFVAKWYDQSGNGNDAVQATAANQPQLVLAATPNGKPALQGSGSQFLATSAIFGQSQPLSLVASAKRTGSFTTTQNVMSLGFANGNFGFNSSANQAFIGFGVGTVAASEADSSFHALIGIANGASSSLNVDGAITTGTAGSNGGGGNPLTLMGGPTATDLNGDLEMAMLFAVSLSASQQAAIVASERAYGGW